MERGIGEREGEERRGRREGLIERTIISKGK